MRRGNDNGWLLDDNRKLVGISLGSDFTAEHEWGIEGIKESFGISSDPKIFGLRRRLISKVPTEKIYFKETGTKSILIFHNSRWFADDLNKTDKHPMIDRELNPYRGDLGTAWDETSFGIYVKDKEGKKRLKQLFEAIQKGAVAIWLGGGGVFQNSGLTIGIVGCIPTDSLQQLFDGDKKIYEADQAAKETGIEEHLKKSGKRWFALSPGSLLKNTKDGDVKTAYKIMFWLNPMDQNLYNYGWFTVEQLKQWAKNEGPIMKTTGE